MERRLVRIFYILELMILFWKYGNYNFKVSIGRNNILTKMLPVHETSYIVEYCYLI
jgi:hypothetical protein